MSSPPPTADRPPSTANGLPSTAHRPPSTANGPPLLFLAPSFLATAWLISQTEWFWRTRPDLGFGYGVPILCAYLFWRAWEAQPPARLRWNLGAIAAGMFGAGLVFLTQIYHAAFGMMPAALTGLAAGLMLLITANLAYVFGGAGVGRFAPAFAFMLLALPLPSAIEGPITFGLQALVTTLNVEVLKLVGVPAQKLGSLIQLPNGAVGINEACSGIRSLQATLMMSLFIGYLKLRHNGLRLALVLLGVFWAVLGNLLRSVFLSCVANAQGTDAVVQYHDSAGWSILAFTLTGVMISAWLVRKLEIAAVGASVRR